VRARAADRARADRWRLLAQHAGRLRCCLLALCALLANSNRNWPIIRRCFDAERIRADYAALRDSRGHGRRNRSEPHGRDATALS
jgi:hypothetical protein